MGENSKAVSLFLYNSLFPTLPRDAETETHFKHRYGQPHVNITQICQISSNDSHLTDKHV